MTTVTRPARKLLILFGSPHEQGHTAQLLDQFMAVIPPNCLIQTVHVYREKIQPCIDCKACLDGSCPFNGDGMDRIIERMHWCDCVILATPIYSMGMPAPLKAIADRMQQFFSQKVLKGNPVFTRSRQGILLATAGSHGEDAKECLRSAATLFFKSMNAPLLEYITITDTDTTAVNWKPNDIWKEDFLQRMYEDATV